MRIHVERHGEGRPVVLIHGWPFSARLWERIEPALVDAGHHVVTYDRRGFGGSSRPWDGYDYDTLAGDLAELLVALDLHDVTLVGFSMGGGEAVRYLSTHGSARVRQLVLVSAVPPGLGWTPEHPAGMTSELVAERKIQILGDRVGFLEEFTKGYFSSAEHGLLISEPTRRYYRDIASWASPRATTECMASFSLTDFRGDLGAIDIPTLVIHGDADGNLPFEISSARSHRAIPTSELAVIPGAPHGLPVTHPDELHGVLAPFLAG